MIRARPRLLPPDHTTPPRSNGREPPSRSSGRREHLPIQSDGSRERIMASGIGEAVSPSPEASVRGMAPHAGPSPSSAPDGATAADGDRSGGAEIRTRLGFWTENPAGIMGRASYESTQAQEEGWAWAGLGGSPPPFRPTGPGLALVFFFKTFTAHWAANPSITPCRHAAGLAARAPPPAVAAVRRGGRSPGCAGHRGGCFRRRISPATPRRWRRSTSPTLS